MMMMNAKTIKWLYLLFLVFMVVCLHPADALAAVSEVNNVEVSIAEPEVGKPIGKVGGFYVSAQVNKELVVKDDDKRDNNQYYMAEVTNNYEGPMQPYTWAEVVITCKAKDGYYFTHDVKTSYDYVYRPDEVIYVDSKTVKLVHYRWIDGKKVDQGKTESMEQYLEMHVIESANWYPHVGTAELYQPIELHYTQNQSNYLYDYPSGVSGVRRTQMRNTTAQISILDWDLTDEIPDMTGDWCRIAFGTVVGFIPKACLTDVVFSDFWEGAPVKLHDSPYKFAGGTGTENDPFLIATAEQLDAVRKNLKAHYKLVADIDLSKWGNWVPIGDTPAFGAGTNKYNKAQFGGGAFMGSFDGNGHVISGMTIVVNEEKPYMQEESNDRYYGLFGITGGAEIKNLGLVNYNIDINYTGVTKDLTMWAGAFSGWFNCNNKKNTYEAVGEMENCYAEGGKISFNVQVAKGAEANISLEVGGLVGTASLGKINRCYHDSDITVKCDSPFYMVGAGICATMCNMWITECYNTGNITLPIGDADMFWRESYVGGIVGEVTPNGNKNTMGKAKSVTSYIANSYNVGNLTANTVAGIYVYNNPLSAGYAEKCYNVGKLTCQEKTSDGHPEFRKADIVASFASCCNSKYIIKCYNNGNKVSGNAWQKSSKLGRMVLKAIPEGEKVVPKETVVPEKETASTEVKVEMPFTDVKADADYAECILWAVKENIISTDKKEFSPDKNCTRAELITFLWRAAGSPKATGTNPYVDLKKSSEYYDAAVWAYEKGITDITIFGGKIECKHAETMLYLWRYVGSPEGFTSNYVAILSKYRPALGWAVEKGITTAVNDKKFDSSKTCTRAEIITFMYRALK